MFERILQEIENHQRIIIHRHTNPDGDAIGSQVGLKHIILENWPEKEVYMVGDPAKRYAFMDDSVMDEIPDSCYDGALAFVLDSGSSKLVNDSRYQLAQISIKMDHHIYCETFTDLEYVDDSMESCCGLITAFASEMGLRINPLAAKSLYTGMVTDSGRFRYDCTSATTFRLASILKEQPFDTNSIYTNLYADDLQHAQLRASFVQKIQLYPGNVGYIYTTLEEFQKLNTDSFTISRGMVNTMSDLSGIDSWVNFTETPEGVLVEIRSSKYNINPIAVKYGGGGHDKASGATIKDHAEAMRMLEDLSKLCEE